MKRFTQFVQKKENRWIIWVGAAIVGFILLMMIMRPRAAQAASTQVVQTGPSEALQAAQMQAQTEMAGIQASLAASSLQAQSALAVEELRAANEASAIQASLDALSIQAQGADRASQRDYELALQQTASNERLQVQALEYDVALQSANIQANLSSQQMQHEATLANTQILADTQRFFAQQSAVTQMYFAQQSAATQQAYLDLEAYEISAQENVALAQIEAQAAYDQQALANQAYGLRRAKRKHVPAILAGDSPQLGTKTNSILGGIFSLGGILSDIRKKRGARQIGERVDGIPMYTYEYAGSEGVYAGVMANDLANISPEYILHTNRGTAVDYIAMDAAA